MSDDPTTRRWRLRGWSGKELVSDTVQVGDHNLDAALRGLEKNPDITRTAAIPF